MTAESFSILTLAAYAAIAAAVMVWQFQRSGLTWGAWLLYAVERIYVPLMFGWKANRRCPFPEEGPALILANHRSPVDPLMIWMNIHLAGPSRRIRIVRWMMAKEYQDVPGVAWIAYHVQTIPVDRGGNDLKAARRAIELLKQGEMVGIFPEGRINTGDGLLEGDTGVAWLALRSQAPVYPVYIHGTPRGKTMIAPFRTPSNVRVTYGDPIDLSDYFDQRKSQSLLREVTDLLMQRLAETGGVEKPDPPAESVSFTDRRQSTG